LEKGSVGSQFFGPNLGYVLELYERFKEDPGSVDERTRAFFEEWGPPKEPSAAGVSGETDVEKVVGATKWIRHIRDFGHLAAQLDPLGSEPPGDPTLDPSFYRISEEDLGTMPASIIIGGPIGERTGTAKEGADELRRVYCSTSGYDFGHVHDPNERFWLREAVESGRFGGPLEDDQAKVILRRLTLVDTFEKFLHRTFLGQKRFSVEGVDMVVPMVNSFVRSAGRTASPRSFWGWRTGAGSTFSRTFWTRSTSRSSASSSSPRAARAPRWPRARAAAGSGT
jgi:2-oxoglutarate dehydrogenase E1 component